MAWKRLPKPKKLERKRNAEEIADPALSGSINKFEIFNGS
jgi:hypothetical protein